MECPACRGPMQPLYAGHLALDRCPGCGVLWFDQHELRQFLALVRRRPAGAEVTAPATPPIEAAACPRCQTQLLEGAHWRGIPLAFCDQCSGLLMTDSALAAVRRRWGALGRRRAPEFQLPLPEGWDDTERKFVEILIGALMGLAR